MLNQGYVGCHDVTIQNVANNPWIQECLHKRRQQFLNSMLK